MICPLCKKPYYASIFVDLSHQTITSTAYGMSISSYCQCTTSITVNGWPLSSSSPSSNISVPVVGELQVSPTPQEPSLEWTEVEQQLDAFMAELNGGHS